MTTSFKKKNMKVKNPKLFIIKKTNKKNPKQITPKRPPPHPKKKKKKKTNCTCT